MYLQAEYFRHLSGTKSFYPPEYFKTGCYKGEDLDFWGASLVLYMMVERTEAFQTPEEVVCKQLTINNNSTSLSYKRFIYQALHKEPAVRLNYKAIWNTVWLDKRFCNCI